MKKTIGGVAMLTLFLTVGATDLVGQLGPRADRSGRGGALAGRAAGPRGPAARGLEGILRLRDRLELTEEQVARLDALRGEQVERRGQEAAELGELRSQLRAGSMERAEARERMLALREARRAQAEVSRTAVAEILNDAQEAELEELRARRRAFEAGRRSAIRDRERGADRPGRPGIQGRRGLRGGP